MRVAKAFAAALVLLASAAGSAMAQDEVESGVFHSHVYYDLGTGLQLKPSGYATQLAGDVYNNTNPTTTVLGGLTTSDMAGTYGDRVTTTNTGILQEMDFTVFNPSTSAGPLNTASFTVGLFNGTTSASLGGFTTGTVTFTGGLTPGFFSIVTITGLSALNINLNTTDVIVTQKIAARTGTATRQGVVLIDPPTIGSSTNTMYISNSSQAAGFYTINSGAVNANPGYRINVQQPVPAATKTWGAIKASYR